MPGQMQYLYVAQHRTQLVASFQLEFYLTPSQSDLPRAVKCKGSFGIDVMSTCGVRLFFEDCHFEATLMLHDSHCNIPGSTNFQDEFRCPKAEELWWRDGSCQVQVPKQKLVRTDRLEKHTTIEKYFQTVFESKEGRTNAKCSITWAKPM